MQNDTSAVRPAEGLDREALVSYLRTHLRSDLAAAFRTSSGSDVEISQFPGGHSNLTYLARAGGVELVIRRPPLGPVAPKAHDMAREYRWLAAVHPAFPLAPEPYLLCEDESVIGAVFYVMERRRGLVVRHEEPPELADNPAARRRLSEALVDTLADLHAIDVSAGALSALGKPAGFVARQVEGWTARWQRAKIAEVPDMEAVGAWLTKGIPANPARPSIVHGDFKLDNVMLDPRDPGKLVAVFDWEMSALGDPLVDLGIFLTYWASGSGPQAPATDALTGVTDRDGYFTRDEILERYQRRSGRDVSAIGFYEIFALFKIAVVIQQIFFRFVRGQTSDPRFATFGDRVTSLARRAALLTQA